MSKVNQLTTMDEIDAANAGQSWLDAVVKRHNLQGRPASEITCETIKDTNITTLWHKNRPIAIVIRQRDDWNYTVMTTIEIEPILS